VEGRPFTPKLEPALAGFCREVPTISSHLMQEIEKPG
jgi:hypothetical protein